MNSNRIRLVLDLDMQDGKFTNCETIAQEMVTLTMNMEILGRRLLPRLPS